MKTLKKLLIFSSKHNRIKYKTENANLTGFMLGENFIQKNDNCRLLNMVIRAIIVCFISLGSMDGFLSAFNIPFDRTMVFSVIILLNFVLMLIQINTLTRIIGYICVLMGIAGYYGQNINLLRSGINALTNMSYELIRIKFKLPIVDGFPEFITDRTQTIPVTIIIFGMCYSVLMWETSGYSMNILMSAMISFAVIASGIFFDGVPSILSVLLLASAWLIIACVKFSGKKNFVFSNKKQYKIVQWGKTQYYFKLLNGKALAQLFAIVITVIISLGSILNTVISQPVFDTNVPESRAKRNSDTIVKNIMIIAFSHYKNFSITGSVSGGQLGQYASIKPDYKPDLEVTYLPTNFDRIYLKSFIGSQYKNNSWEPSPEKSTVNNKKETNFTADALKNQGVPFAKMRIKNIDLTTSKPFLPYTTDLYSCDKIIYNDDTSVQMQFARGDEYDVIYYPYADISIDDEEYRNYVYDNFLQIPKKNSKLIHDLCIEQGFNADDPELEQKLSDYFANEFTYTLNPGLVPWQTDFVNYFLFENKQGVCSHFASAGVLIYRSLGIPARYVEGYALDYPLVREEQTVLENEDISEWLGRQPTILANKPVSVTLNDFCAHSWVEIYKDNYGWIPVELTPSAENLEENSDNETAENMTDQIIDFFMSANTDMTDFEEQNNGTYKNHFGDITLIILVFLIIAFIIILLIKLLIILIRHIKRLIIFNKKDADAVIEIYSYITKILIFNGALKQNPTHKDICTALSGYTHTPETIIDIIQQLLYAPTPPENEDYVNVFIVLHDILDKVINDKGLLNKIKVLAKF